METLAWNYARGWLIKNGYAQSSDFLPPGPLGNISIDYSNVPQESEEDERKRIIRLLHEQIELRYAGNM